MMKKDLGRLDADKSTHSDVSQNDSRIDVKDEPSQEMSEFVGEEIDTQNSASHDGISSTTIRSKYEMMIFISLKSGKRESVFIFVKYKQMFRKL